MIARRSTSPWWIPIWLGLALMVYASGCVSAEVHRASEELLQDLSVLEDATVPDPRYGAEGRLKVLSLRLALRKNAEAIRDATR